LYYVLMSEDIKWTEERSWDEFRESGIFCWVNRILHTFGWVLVVDVDDAGKAVRCYPARCRYRGFGAEAESKMFKRISRWMRDNSEELVADSELD
jgi:hypothetical protein